jgi:hypothetical protein
MSLARISGLIAGISAVVAENLRRKTRFSGEKRDFQAKNVIFGG